jgi:amino acid permease
MIGGGIVSLPFALSSVGILTGIICHISVILLYFISIVFYVKAKDYLGYESIP